MDGHEAWENCQAILSVPYWPTAVRQSSTPQKVLPDVCKTFKGQLHTNWSKHWPLLLSDRPIYPKELGELRFLKKKLGAASWYLLFILLKRPFSCILCYISFPS